MEGHGSAYRAAIDADSTKKFPAGFPGISEYSIVRIIILASKHYIN